MPILEVFLNENLVAAAGGDDIEVLTFGVLRASHADKVIAQLTGMNRATSQHMQWLYLVLSASDRVRVTFQEDGPVSKPLSVWQSPSRSESAELTRSAGMGLENSSFSEIASTPVNSLKLQFDGEKCVQATAGIGSNLQITVTWSRAAGKCRVEMGAIEINDQQNEVWFESSIEAGEEVRIELK